MPVKNRWPDFRLASSLWSHVGQPDKDDKEERNPPRRNASPNRGDFPRTERARDSSEADEEKTSHGADKPAKMMTDEQGLPIEDVGNMESYQGAEDEDQEMEDFGPLAMFDSNLSQAPFSSAPPAPEADMSAPPVPIEEPKHKKTKKSKKHSLELSQELEEQEPPTQIVEETASKPKRSKRKSAAGSSEAPQSPQGDAGAVTAQEPDEAITATARSRKRKGERSSDGKRRKKHKHGEEEKEVNADEQADNTGERPVSKGSEGGDFLHRGRQKKDLSQVIAQDDLAASASDPQASPSVAAQRHRSQSREARSRSASVAGRHDQGVEEEPHTFDSMDVENLAREAFNEHLNGAATNATTADEDVEMKEGSDNGNEDKDQDDNEDANEAAEPAENAYDVPDSPKKSPEPEENGRSKRSLRPRKPAAAKEAFNEPPPPPAPKPRAKKATKKRVVKAPPRQIRRDSTEDERPEVVNVDVAAQRAEKRRARMAGFKQGRFTDEEFARVKAVLDAYRGESNMSEHEVVEMLHAPGGTSAGGLHADLWTRIFAELPDRQRQKTINATRKKFHNFVARGTWTPEQDAELTALIGIHGTAWSKIAALINRHPEDLRDRYRNYIVCGANQRKDTWEEGEEQLLTQIVINSMREIDQLRIENPEKPIWQKTYDELLDWQLISEQMGRTRSRLQCITKWKAMNLKASGNDTLESSENADVSFSLEKARRQITQMPEEERHRLLLAINETSVDDDRKIPWQKLIDKPYRNTWHRYTQMLLWHRFKQTVPQYQNKTTRDIAQFLVDQFNHTRELPAIDTMTYDPVEETIYLTGVGASKGHSKKNAGAKRTQNKSSQYVANSDDENHGEMDGGPALKDEEIDAMADAGEMQIDPALMATAPEAQMDEPIITATAPPPEAADDGAGEEVVVGTSGEAEGGPSQVSVLAEETPTKKSKTPRKKASSSAKKTHKTMSQEDPIEDVEMAALPTQESIPDDLDASQLEEPAARKKTPGKFRAPGSAVAQPQAQDASAAGTALTESYSSDMDDMEDLPARVLV